MKQVTIHDIARRLNLTASTVSRALHNHPRISKKTRELVKKTAEELNYRPNSIATSLRTGKANSIGLIVPKINRFFFADTISGIESVTSPAGYSLIICQSNENYRKEVENIKTLMRSRVAGIIISISNETVSSGHLKVISENGIPLVQFDRVRTDLRSSMVVNTNYRGSYELARHLVEEGFHRFAYLTGPLHLNIYKERYEGFRQGLKEYAVDLDPSMICDGELTYQFGFDSVGRLLKKDLPDAIVSAGDYAALGVLFCLKQAGKRVPDDIAVAGYANEQVTAFCDPAITTVEQYAHRLGSNAANLILEEIAGKQQAKPARTVEVNTHLIIRESTVRNK